MHYEELTLQCRLMLWLALHFNYGADGWCHFVSCATMTTAVFGNTKVWISSIGINSILIILQPHAHIGNFSYLIYVNLVGFLGSLFSFTQFIMHLRFCQKNNRMKKLRNNIIVLFWYLDTLRLVQLSALKRLHEAYSRKCKVRSFQVWSWTVFMRVENS